MANRPWTTKEHNLFLEMYPYYPNPYIAKKLNRTTSAIENRARKNKLFKHPDYKDEGLPFVKGHKTWNKGIKFNPPGSEKGRFKPGHGGTRALPMGIERVRAGVLERKINNFHGPEHRKNFKAVKVIVWESVHGPVPEGMVIRVMTDNPMDAVHVECLACITRAENFRLNTVKNDWRANNFKAWETRRGQPVVVRQM